MIGSKRRFKRCIFFLVDGARPDVLEEKVHRGELPNVSKVFFENGDFRWATTVFPSTTGPAYAPFMTGVFPGGCDLPGIRWFDRRHYSGGGWNHKAMRSYVGVESYLMNRDLSPRIRTLFELLSPGVSIFSMINRGVSFAGNRSKFSRAAYMLYAHYTGDWTCVDRASQKRLLASIRRAPRYTFMVLPGVDEHSHLSDPHSERAGKGYRTFDETVGRVVSELKAHQMLDDTLLVASSDHGLSQTAKHLELWKVLEEKGWPTLYYPKIWKRKFRAVCMVSGNAMANLYFQGPRGWGVPITHGEFQRAGLLDALLEREEIDQVITRSEKEGWIISSRLGQARLETSGKMLYYEVKGKDPFGFEEMPTEMSRDESLERTFGTAYPDALVQIAQLFKSERTGDVLVTSRPGFDLRDEHEHPEHFSSHGSLHREHMMIPMLFNCRLKSKRRSRSVDVFPTILDLLDEPRPTYKIDGESLVSS